MKSTMQSGTKWLGMAMALAMAGMLAWALPHQGGFTTAGADAAVAASASSPAAGPDAAMRGLDRAGAPAS